MATALFISRTDLVKNTILDGNVDSDKFLQFVKISQEIHIQNYLGSKLYDRISADIVAVALVVDYIQPMLIHFAMMDYLPFAAFQVSNGGIFKHNSENSQTASKDEVDFLVQKERSFAEYYTRRFVDFICFDSSKFPEYNNNTEADVYPEKRVQYSNFVL
jgi:hypothetical protein